MQSTITLTLNLTTKKGLITDTTDYDALGFTQEKIELGLGKGLGTLKFNGIIIEQRLDVNNPLIDLETGARTFEFDLVLDNNFNPAYGVYTLEYSVRFAPTGLQFDGASADNLLIADGDNQYANFLEEGNVISINGASSIERTIEEVALVSGIAQYTLNENVAWDTPYDNYSFDVTNPTFSNEWAYMGCTQAEACPTFVADCDAGTNGSFTVDDNTQLNGATIVGLNCKISYPSWTKLENPSFNPDIVVTSLPYNNTTLATGTYSVILTLQLSQVESNGLILTYNTVSSKEFPVSCINSMCGMTSCIEKLNEAHDGALLASRVSPYQLAVDTVNLQTILYNVYKSCGEYDKALNALGIIQKTLNDSNTGCNCGCGGEDELFWVQNTANSTTQYIDQVKALVAFRLINGVPTNTTDSSVGVLVGYVYEDVNTGIEYRCVDNTVSAAVWVVHYTPADYTYYANLTQTSTNDPVPSNEVTNIEDAPLISYIGVGNYQLAFGGTELSGKAMVTISNGLGGIVSARKISNSAIEIRTFIGSTPTDGVLTDATLRIDVYP